MLIAESFLRYKQEPQRDAVSFLQECIRLVVQHGLGYSRYIIGLFAALQALPECLEICYKFLLAD